MIVIKWLHLLINNPDTHCCGAILPSSCTIHKGQDLGVRRNLNNSYRLYGGDISKATNIQEKSSDIRVEKTT